MGAAATPEVAANPAVIRVGRVTTIAGSGFPPSRPVTVRIDGEPLATRVVAGPDGDFVADVNVSRHASPGTHQVIASFDQLAPPLRALAPILVAGGTLRPPDFLDRG
jgi:hypothetical protein